jgi:hypothetical protein
MSGDNMLFDDLKSDWITQMYLTYHALILPSVDKQLSMGGWMLDLGSLPTRPYPFRELFIRWLISINKDRIASGQPVIVTYSIILKCPLWKIVKCPIKRITKTKEGLFNKPTPSQSTIGTKGTKSTINSSK